MSSPQRWAAYYAGDDLHLLETVWGVASSWQQAMSEAWRFTRGLPRKAEVRAHLKALPLAACDCTGEIVISVDGKGTLLQERKGELHTRRCVR